MSSNKCFPSVLFLTSHFDSHILPTQEGTFIPDMDNGVHKA